MHLWIKQEKVKTRSSDVQVAANRGKRKAPEGDENGRGKRRSVKSDEPKSSPQIDKRLAPKRTILGIHGCVSPQCSASTYCSSFSWYEQDAWTYVSRFLNGKSLVMLGTTSKWFNKIVMEDAIWRFACLRDLQVPKPYPSSSSWIKIYASAFGEYYYKITTTVSQNNGKLRNEMMDDADGRSHSYLFHQQEKHIDWMRIGAFTLDSRVSLLTEKLSSPLRVPREGTIERMLESSGSCIVKDIKSDLQLVRCPVCDLSTCDGTMQTLDVRHIELFFNEGYKNGSWEYNLIASHRLQKDAVAACGAIFDLKHLKSSSSCILNLKSWTGAPDDSQPKAMIAVAGHTRLQENEGIVVKYQTMKAGTDSDILSIRISKQLL
uniref:F-box domain-containing protein n=1 Tax=Brassica oleracea var. oleracea TaxID=109376 RepID=A0A0D3BWE2_BRAOL